jgi:hypothetical protein
MDHSKRNSPSKSLKADSIASLEKKRLRTKEENIASFIEADNKKRQKTSDLDPDIAARN